MTELAPRDVTEILQAAFDFSSAIGRATNRLSVQADIRSENRRIVALVEEYCSKISGREEPLEERPSTHSGWLKLQPPPKAVHTGKLRLQHQPHMKTWPRFRLIWPEAGAVEFSYMESAYGFQGEAQFNNLEEAMFWAKLVARAVHDELNKKGSRRST